MFEGSTQIDHKSTVSDRSHAHVATYLFGNRARLINETRQSLFFEQIRVDSTSEEFVEPNLDRLRQDKKEEGGFSPELE